MTEIPEWVDPVRKADGGVHGPIPSIDPREALREDEVTSLRDRLQESVLQQVVLATRGVFTPGPVGTALDQLREWAEATDNIFGDAVGAIIEIFTGVEDGDLDDLGTWINTNIREPLTEAAQAFAQMLMKFFLIDDLIEILSGKEDGDTTDVGTVVGNIIDGIQTTVNAIVRGLFGWVGDLFDYDQAENALADAAATVAALSATVTALQNDKDNIAIGGKAVVIDFRERADTTGMGSDFSIAYTGSGTGYFAISGNKVTWVNNDSTAPRTGIFRYLDLETAGDYQKIGIAFGAAMVNPLSNKPHNYIHGRMNSTGNTYVYADFTKTSVELGCVVSGSKTVFTSRSISFKANALYYLECGTVGGLRVFRVLEGNTPVLTHTEVGTTSQAGSGYRYAGGGAYAYGYDFFGPQTYRPADMLAFAVADNQPPTVVGSGAVITRTTATAVNISSGLNVLPASFWTTPLETTADLTIDYTNGRIKVSIAGWYDVNVRLQTAETVSTGTSGGNATPWPMQLALFTGTGAGSPSLLRYIGDSVRACYTSGPSGATNATATWVGPRAIAASARVFLDVDDYVAVGYDADAAKNSFLQADASGYSTFFSVTLANRSLA